MMETREESTSAPDDGSSVEPPRRGKLGRIAGETRALVEDLREWIDLRIDLAVLEVEEQVDRLRNEVALGLTLAFFGFFAVLFVLLTAAFGLGWLLGRPFWGFLIVSGFLVLLVAVLAKTRPDLMPPSQLFESVRGRPPSAVTSDDSPEGTSAEATAAVNAEDSS